MNLARTQMPSGLRNNNYVTNDSAPATLHLLETEFRTNRDLLRLLWAEKPMHCYYSGRYRPGLHIPTTVQPHCKIVRTAQGQWQQARRVGGGATTREGIRTRVPLSPTSNNMRPYVSAFRQSTTPAKRSLLAQSSGFASSRERGHSYR